MHRWETDGRILRGYDRAGALVFVDRDFTLITELQTAMVRAFDGLTRIPATRIWRRAA